VAPPARLEALPAAPGLTPVAGAMLAGPPEELSGTIGV
jgi:hypothetical protein